MKEKELSPERIRVQELVQKAHQANLEDERYVATELVTVISRIPRRIGPFLLPDWFAIRRSDTTKHDVCTITPPDDNVVMVKIENEGAVAIKPQGAHHYEVFDFHTGSSEDFHTVKVALQKWMKIPQGIYRRD